MAANCMMQDSSFWLSRRQVEEAECNYYARLSGASPQAAAQTSSAGQSSLASEIAKAREQIKQSLKVNEASGDNALLTRLIQVEEENRELRKVTTDLQAAMKALEARIKALETGKPAPAEFNQLNISKKASVSPRPEESICRVREGVKVGALAGAPPLPADPVHITADTSLIVFDLECTGLIRGSHYPHVTQWCAQDYCTGDVFATYVKPIIAISQKAHEMTHIAIDGGGAMTHHGKPVDSVTFPEAVERFLEYLGAKTCILCAHNGKRFDFLVLVKALAASGQLDRFLAKVVGFADTIHIFRDKLPGRSSYAEGNLVADILQEPFDAHNAIDDVEALVKVMKKVSITRTDCVRRVLWPDSVFSDMEKKARTESLKVLLSEGVCSKSLLDTMATSGLALRHLSAVFEAQGEEGLRQLFVSPNTDGKPRVTAHKPTLKKVLPKLAEYLAKA